MSSMPVPTPRPFTVAEYHRMIETGILTDEDRVELLEGRIVVQMPHNPPHDGTVWLVQTALLPRLPAGWVLRVQSAMTTGDSEPEPDLVVASGPGTRYVTEHPQPRDVALVVEVADSSLSEDQTTKARLYARARIPVYWIINLPDSRVEVLTAPRGGRNPVYRTRQHYSRQDAVPLVIAGRVVCPIPAAELLT